MGKTTRTKVREELFKLFGRERWGKGYERESHVFDMVLALHPGCRQLHYMDKMSESPDEVWFYSKRRGVVGGGGGGGSCWSIGAF